MGDGNTFCRNQFSECKDDLMKILNVHVRYMYNMTKKEALYGKLTGVHFRAFERNKAMHLALSTIVARLPEAYGALL